MRPEGSKPTGPRDRRRTAMTGVALLLAAALGLGLASRAHPPTPATSVAPGPDAGAGADLAPAPARPASAPPEAAPHLAEAVTRRIRADFERAHPLLEDQAALSGRVVGPNGLPVGDGLVDYRSPGGAWKRVRVAYDGTFDISDPEAGPFELVASGGSAPPNRHATPATAAAGADDVVLRAPGAGRLRFEAPIGRMTLGVRAYLTREDEDSLGLEASGRADVDLDGKGEFTGLEPDATYVVFVHDVRGNRYALRRGVRAGTEPLEIPTLATAALDASILEAGCIHSNDGRLVARGVGIRLGFPLRYARDDGTEVVGAAVTGAFLAAEHRRVYAELPAPRIRLHLVASGTSCDGARAFTLDEAFVPGDAVVARWKDAK